MGTLESQIVVKVNHLTVSVLDSQVSIPNPVRTTVVPGSLLQMPRNFTNMHCDVTEEK